MNSKGIAIGPILMVIALIGVIMGVMSMGMGDMGGSANADRITADLRGQIDMIRTKIGECTYLTRQVDAPQYLYPAYDNLDTAVNVKDLDCPRDPAGQRNLWAGRRPSNLPPPPPQFDEWKYVNHGNPDDGASPGGICIYIQPTSVTTAANTRVREGISKALMRLSPSEYTYDAGSANQRIIIWIKRPASGTTC